MKLAERDDCAVGICVRMALREPEGMLVPLGAALPLALSVGTGDALELPHSVPPRGVALALALALAWAEAV